MRAEGTLDIRAGTREDIPVLLGFIRQMAAFERLPVTATEASLERALFADPPAAYTLLAFAEGAPVAYATYFFTFASTIGRRGLWLDDLFVAASFRGRGIGQALMAVLADVAVRHDCGRFEWTVLDWNERAIGFYRQLGASILDDWRLCRLEEAELARLAGGAASG